MICHVVNQLIKFQRPYAIATAGMPMSLQYYTESGEFSYRFRSPYNPATSPEEESSTTPPSTEGITELFLPRRIYPKHLTKYILSPGGRIYFDWENQRAYIWFIDKPNSEVDGIPSAVKSKKVRTRRVDIWVGERQIPGWEWWHTLLMVLAWLLAVVGIVWMQKRDWSNERRMGFKPWAGFKLFGSGKWND